MGVLGHSQTEMTDLGKVDCRHTEVYSLIHAASGQDSNNFVEEWIVLAFGEIKRFCKFLGGLCRHLEPKFGKLLH